MYHLMLFDLQDPLISKEMERGFQGKRPGGTAEHLRVIWKLGRESLEMEAGFWREGKVSLGAVKKSHEQQVKKGWEKAVGHMDVWHLWSRYEWDLPLILQCIPS